MRDLEDKTLVLLVVAASLLFGWILSPLFGAILWAVVLAILFVPLYRLVLKFMPRSRNFAALATLVTIIVLVILPLTLIGDLLVRETTAVYKSIQSGELTFSLDFERVRQIVPAWVTNLLDRLGLPNLNALRERLSEVMMEGGRFLAGQAINIGQRTVGFIVSFFVMLYLLFFLLRDGTDLSRRIWNTIPLRAEQQKALLETFTVTVRAIVKGTVVVALVQGALGGLMFWLLGIRAAVLWGALMAAFSLLPVGTAIVWGPVAIYYLVSGAIWQGLVLIVFGALVIGLVDNILRPLLIGQDTKIPDYVVLISTLGGFAIFGAHGFVIGPVIAAMFIALWTVFSASRRRSSDKRIDG